MLLLFNHLSFKILTKFGFKKIWIEKHGELIQFWGEFDPKVPPLPHEFFRVVFFISKSFYLYQKHN
ncbi:hypothetical protein D3C71_17980 [compost metagenome]